MTIFKYSSRAKPSKANPSKVKQSKVKQSKVQQGNFVVFSIDRISW